MRIYHVKGVISMEYHAYKVDRIFDIVTCPSIFSTKCCLALKAVQGLSFYLSRFRYLPSSNLHCTIMLFPIAGIVAFASIVQAVPAAQKHEKQGVRVHQVATGKQHVRSGPLHLAHTLNKFTKHIPEHINVAAKTDKAKKQQQQQGGVVTASSIDYDEEYLCPLLIGSPAVTLNLDFDTGSSDFWVFSGQMPSQESAGHSLYRPHLSYGAQAKRGYTWKIEYGDGSGSSGNVFMDKVRIGPITATQMAVECATSVSPSFTSDKNNDGLVGLAMSSLNTVQPKPAKTFFDTIQNQLPEQVFTAYLRHDAPGAYTFGYLNQSEYQDPIVYAPLNQTTGFWSFTAAGYAVGGSMFSGTLSCIADTGTSLVLLQGDVVSAYYGQVSGASQSQEYGGWVFPCSADLPAFGITMENGDNASSTFRIPGQYISYAQVSDSVCYGGLRTSAGVGFNILGGKCLADGHLMDYSLTI